MKAVILAGGKGTRLGAVTKQIPKPMVPIGNKPLLLHQINLCKHYNITDITIITGYLSGVIEAYFGDGSKFAVKISYFIEPSPLGTTGGLKEIEHELDEAFLLFYGDVMVNMNLTRFMNFHKEKKADATLVVHPNDQIKQVFFCKFRLSQFLIIPYSCLSFGPQICNSVAG